MSDKLSFAGDQMRLTENPDGSASITWDNKGTGRRCGECTLCCKLVPVPQLTKPAGKKCQHAKYGKGCTIYARRPNVCRAWSCRWLADPLTAAMPRPDRCHYVIDLSYDYITMINHETGVSTKITVLQVWVDPAFPDAHRAPELRAYMLSQAEKGGIATIVRWNSRDAMTIFPPPISSDRQWHEIRDGTIEARDAEEAAVLRDFR
jgi:hypothetical protein